MAEFVPPPGAVDISPDQDGGLWKEVKTAGTGSAHPLAGDTVSVHYVGTLLDGSQFDSSRERGDKFEFKLGEGSVIKGWDVGVATMLRGEVAVLTCKSEFGYGPTGSPPKIPPHATLVFEVELFEWKGEDVTADKDGGVLKSSLRKGDGFKTPKDEALVKVQLVGYHGDREFENREVEFNFGDGEEHGIVEGVEMAIGKMKPEEKAQVTVKSKYAYGSTGNAEKGIPADADLVYKVEMLSFENMKETWEMEDEEKVAQAEIVKQKGTTHFKNSKFKRAKACYDKAVEYLKYETSMEGEAKEKREALLLAAYLNLAMCSIKVKDYPDALKHCESALELDPQNEKAIFRRGTIHMESLKHEEAMSDFEQVLKISPQNKAAKNQWVLAQHKVQEFKNKQKKVFGGMFDRFAKIDAAKNPESVKEKEVEEELKDDVHAEGPDATAV